MSLTPGSRSSRRLVAGVVLTASFVAIPATATAASGTTSVTLGGAASRSLKAQGAKFSATKPAKATSKRLTFTVSGGSVAAKTATLTHGGTLRLKVGKRSVTLSRFQVRLGGKSPRVTARLGRSTVTFVTLKAAKKRPATFNRGAATARVTSATATIPASTAKRLRTALKLKRSPAGRLGTITVKANVSKPKPPAVKPPVVAPPVVKPPVVVPPVVTPPVVIPPVTTPTTPVDPPAEICPLPAADATAVTGPSTWRLKPSWVNYLYLAAWGPGNGVFGTDGADRTTAGQNVSWDYSRASVSTTDTGETVIAHTGQLQFLVTSHHIDSRIKDPRIVVAADGQSARLCADGQGSGDMNPGATEASPEPYENAHLLDIDLAAATRSYSADLTDRRWLAAPATVADNVVASRILSYDAGEPFGDLDFGLPTSDPVASLDWVQQKLWTASPATNLAGQTIDRTWLGYIARGPGAATPRGWMEPTLGATGPRVDMDSPLSAPLGAGGDYTVRYTATNSTFALAPAGIAASSGTVQFSGKVAFESAALPNGHGHDLAVDDPRVIFDGDATATLVADGRNGTKADPSTYTDEEIFSLDLTAATTTDNGDGTVTVSGIVPSIVTSNMPFNNYPAGSGPDRVPNTFGSFTLRLPKTVG